MGCCEGRGALVAGCFSIEKQNPSIYMRVHGVLRVARSLKTKAAQDGQPFNDCENAAARAVIQFVAI